MEVIIEWSDKSKNQIRDIFDYYSSQISPQLAKKIVQTILVKPNILVQQPNIGKREDILLKIDPRIRVLIEGHFKIVYLREKGKIIILSVFDSRQDPEKLIDL